MKKFNFIFTGICIVLLIIVIINFGMNWWIFDKLGNGSDDGWLGFWGGFLGAIFAVAGVWWQTNKTIKNEKELMFSQKRPYIVIRESNIPNDEISSIYVKKKYSPYKNEPVILIKNLSNNPMFSVKFIVQYDDRKEEIVADRIEANSNIGININSEVISETIKQMGMIYPVTSEEKRNFEEKVKLVEKSGVRDSFSESIEALKYFDVANKECEYINAVKKSINNYNMSTINYDLIKEFIDKYIADKYKQTLYEMPNNVIITVYFTTTVREKIKLVFVKKDGKYRYQKSKTKLENKGELITEKEYDTSDMYESYKLGDEV